MTRRSKLGFWVKLSVLAVVIGTVGLNVSAILHARAMMEFSATGSRTASPEDLSFSRKVAVLLTGVTIPRPVNSRSPRNAGLEFDTHNYPSANGETIEAWHVPGSGSGVLVLMFHGYASSKESLLATASELHVLGCDLLLVDFYGSGGSSGSGTSVGFLEAHDVAASVDYARSAWPERKILLYGVSMGGAAVLRAIAEHDVRPDAIALENVFDRLLSTVENRFHVMGVPATPLSQLLLFWGGRQRGFDAFSHNPASYAGEVQCPALVLHGSEDLRVTELQARAVYRALRGWKRFATYQEAGHRQLATVETVRWRQDVTALLDRLNQAG